MGHKPETPSWKLITHQQSLHKTRQAYLADFKRVVEQSMNRYQVRSTQELEAVVHRLIEFQYHPLEDFQIKNTSMIDAQLSELLARGELDVNIGLAVRELIAKFETVTKISGTYYLPIFEQYYLVLEPDFAGNKLDFRSCLRKVDFALIKHQAEAEQISTFSNKLQISDDLAEESQAQVITISKTDKKPDTPLLPEKV